MGMVPVPEQLLQAVLSGDLEVAVPGAMQLREALLLLPFHHAPLDLSGDATSARTMHALQKESLDHPPLRHVEDVQHARYIFQAVASVQ